MRLETAVLSQHEKLNPTHFRMTLDCHGAFGSAQPGQFVMLHLIEDDTPLLPRPFSIHRMRHADSGRTELQILYRVVGPTTRKMERLQSGDALQIFGPLGRGFTLPQGKARPTLVAGGIGVAPLVFLVERLLENGQDPRTCHFFLGAQTEEDLLCREDLLSSGVTVHLTTDDGSLGEHCRVTHPFQRSMGIDPPDILYACGPWGMLRCVAQAAIGKIPCQVSVETVMACGMGACLGCAVAGRSKNRYLHACTDGPVFEAETLEWDRPPD